MGDITTIDLPKDDKGNDPKAHRNDPDYMVKLNGSPVTPTATAPPIDDALNVINKAIEKLKDGDTGAHWEASVLDAGRTLLELNQAEFYRQRGKIKEAHKEAQVTKWERAIKDTGEESNGKADELVSMVLESCILFHDEQDNAYATIEHEGHYETWPITSDGFNKFVGFKAYKELGYTQSPTTLATAFNSLKGLASYEGEEHQVYLRCAQIENGYLIDQTNDDWTALKVTNSGWGIEKKPNKKFIRSSTATAIVTPAVEGNLTKLWEHINIPEQQRTLLIAFILESWRPNTPYPILELSGEQGSAKSTTHKCIRQISDPNREPLRTAPKGKEDLFVSAANNHQASFENMSNLSNDMQDALCTIATGGATSARKLYSDSDESVISVKRPIIINGISPVATRPDLIDRVVHIDLPRISSYTTEDQLQKNFDRDLPEITGGLLTLFCKTLAKLPTIKIDQLPRMADFVLLGEAMHQALERDDSFKDVFMANRTESLQRSLDSSPVAMAVQAMIKDERSFDGMPKDLLWKLSHASHRQPSEGWPKSAKGLSDILRRTAPALREVGVEVTFPARTRDGARILISEISNRQAPTQPTQDE